MHDRAIEACKSERGRGAEVMEAFDVLVGGGEVAEELGDDNVHGVEEERGKWGQGALDGEVDFRDEVDGGAGERTWVCWED